MNKALREEVDHLAAALNLLEEAKEAFVAIGDMMQPVGINGDEQLDLVHRSQAAAIFRFFGHALECPVSSVMGTKNRLDMAAMKGGAERAAL